MGNKKKDLSASVGSRIRDLRKGQNLTQMQLAQKASVNWKYLGEMETGRRDVRVNTLARVAAALDVEPIELFRFTEEDVTAAEIGTRLHGRDQAFRGHVLRVLNEILLLTESAK